MPEDLNLVAGKAGQRRQVKSLNADVAGGARGPVLQLHRALRPVDAGKKHHPIAASISHRVASIQHGGGCRGAKKRDNLKRTKIPRAGKSADANAIARWLRRD